MGLLLLLTVAISFPAICWIWAIDGKWRRSAALSGALLIVCLTLWIGLENDWIKFVAGGGEGLGAAIILYLLAPSALVAAVIVPIAALRYARARNSAF